MNVLDQLGQSGGVNIPGAGGGMSSVLSQIGRPGMGGPMQQPAQSREGMLQAWLQKNKRGVYAPGVDQRNAATSARGTDMSSGMGYQGGQAAQRPAWWAQAQRMMGGGGRPMGAGPQQYGGYNAGGNAGGSYPSREQLGPNFGQQPQYGGNSMYAPMPAGGQSNIDSMRASSLASFATSPTSGGNAGGSWKVSDPNRAPAVIRSRRGM